MAFDFTSTGSRIGSALKKHLVEQEVQRRQAMLDGLMVQDRFRQAQIEDQAARRQAALDQRQLERDRVADQRYETERKDNLMARADEQGQRYLANERADVQRQEEQKQRNLDRADAAGQRYQDAELRRQEQEAERADRARENAANRANARTIAGISASGRANGEGKTTEGQRKTGGLLYRAQAARDTADSLEGKIGIRDFGPAFLRSPEGKQYRQAASQWIQSVLRDESGAAIGKDEEASYMETYFRTPWDDAATIAQKQAARDAAEEAMAAKVGGSGQPRPVPSHDSGNGWTDHGNGVRVRRTN